MLHINYLFYKRFRLPLQLIPGLSILAFTLAFYLAIQYLLSLILAVSSMHTASEVALIWRTGFVLANAIFGFLYCWLLFSVFKNGAQFDNLLLAFPIGILYAGFITIEFAFLLFKDYFNLQDELSLAHFFDERDLSLFSTIEYRFEIILSGTEGQESFLWLVIALSLITVMLPWFIVLLFRISHRYEMLQQCYTIQKHII